MRQRPIQSHAALRGVHRLRDAKALVEKIVAECQRLVPVQPAGGAQGIGHHMGGRKGDAVEWGFRLPDGDGLARQMISFGFSFRCRQT